MLARQSPVAPQSSIGLGKRHAARLPELDFLRTIAILMVVGSHMRPAARTIWWPVRTLADFWNRCGWMGVDLFFVLSGFLVSGLLFEEYKASRRISLGRFLVRRGLKIYPTFYLLIFVTCVLFFVPALAPLRWAASSWRYIWPDALFLQNYLGSVWNHTWSLAVEEHFYLGLGFVAWGLARRATPPSFADITRLTFATCAVVLVVRTVQFWFTGAAGANYSATHLRIDSLLFGVWLSGYSHFRRDALTRFVRAHAGTITTISLVLLLPSTFFHIDKSAFINSVGFTMIYLGFGGLLIVLLYDPRAQRVFRRPIALLAPIGVYSYSIYVFHMIVRRIALLAFTRLAPRTPYIVELAAYIAGSLVLGFIVAKLVEIPALRFRDRFFPSRAAAIEGPTPLIPPRPTAGIIPP